MNKEKICLVILRNFIRVLKEKQILHCLVKGFKATERFNFKFEQGKPFFLLNQTYKLYGAANERFNEHQTPFGVPKKYAIVTEIVNGLLGQAFNGMHIDGHTVENYGRRVFDLSCEQLFQEFKEEKQKMEKKCGDTPEWSSQRYREEQISAYLKAIQEKRFNGTIEEFLTRF